MSKAEDVWGTRRQRKPRAYAQDGLGAQANLQKTHAHTRNTKAEADLWATKLEQTTHTQTDTGCSRTPFTARTTSNGPHAHKTRRASPRAQQRHAYTPDGDGPVLVELPAHEVLCGCAVEAAHVSVVVAVVALARRQLLVVARARLVALVRHARLVNHACLVSQQGARGLSKASE